MIDIDKKDRKILYQLDLDSRQTVTQIGRKVNLKKDVVSYRIRKLIKKGIIQNFYTVIDSSKLGYTSFRIYLIFQRTTPEIEKEIINYFIKNKNIWLVCSLKGIYDHDMIVWVKEINDFYSFWKKTIQKYHKYFQKQIVSIYNQSLTYRNSFLLEDDLGKTDRVKYEIVGRGKQVIIDDLDFGILKILAPNTRISTVKIAKILNSTSITVKNRIKRLIKLDVIQGFRVNIDFSKLGYYFYKAEIQLEEYSKRDEIINYITKNSHLTMIDESVGVADLELDFIVENINTFYEIMDDLNNEFPGAIKNYKYFYVSKIHKLLYLPEKN